MSNSEAVSAAQAPEAEATEVTGRRPPFMFAKRHRMLVSELGEDHADIVLTLAADPRALVELRRFVAPVCGSSAQASAD